VEVGHQQVGSLLGGFRLGGVGQHCLKLLSPLIELFQQGGYPLQQTVALSLKLFAVKLSLVVAFQKLVQVGPRGLLQGFRPTNANGTACPAENGVSLGSGSWVKLACFQTG